MLAKLLTILTVSMLFTPVAHAENRKYCWLRVVTFYKKLEGPTDDAFIADGKDAMKQCRKAQKLMVYKLQMYLDGLDPYSLELNTHYTTNCVCATYPVADATPAPDHQ